MAAFAINSAALALFLALAETDEALEEALKRLDDLEIVDPFSSCSSNLSFAMVVKFPILSMKSHILQLFKYLIERLQVLLDGVNIIDVYSEQINFIHLQRLYSPLNRLTTLPI